ncbi:hypothetical protein [Rhodoflexus sp.]
MKRTAFASMLLSALLLFADSLSAANYYWVHPGTALANWSDAANWRTTSGGATAHATPPTSADNVFFDANSFATTGRTVVVDVSAVCANMVWTGATNAPTFAINNSLTIHGNLTFIAGMTVSGAGTVTFAGGSNVNITSAGKVFGGNVSWEKDPGASAALVDAFATSGAFILNQDGDFNSANQNITCQRFEMVNVGTANMGASTIDITGASNTPPSLDLSGGGTINLATATLNFSNTAASATTRLVLGDNSRNNGNITVAGAAALKNVLMEGSVDHQIGALTIGGNVNFSQSTGGFDYTYGSVTVAASTVAGAGVNFESTTIVTGTTTIGALNAVTFKGVNTQLTGAVSFGNGNTVSFQNTGTVTFGNTLTLTATAATTPVSSITFTNSVTNVTHTGGVTLGGVAGSNVNYNNTGTVTFSNTMSVSAANAPNFNTVTFGNTVTNVSHNHNVTLNGRAVLNYNNTGFVHIGNSPTNRNLTINGSNNTLTLGATVTTFSVTGNTNLGASNNITLNNSGNINFGDAAGDTFTAGNNTVLNVGAGGAGKNFTISGSATFGTGNSVSINNSGNTSINGAVTYNGGGNFQYGNGGTATFGSTITANNISGALAINFTNGGATTYNGAVSLTTAAGPTNNITYNFAGGQTANINANFAVAGACNNLITIGRTGSGSATLNLSATPANRNWVRVNVSNIDASSLANNIRAYAYTDGGGNSGIDFRNNSTSANRTLYWVAGGPQTGTNTLWSNPNNWSFEPDEFVPAVCIPTVADSVVFGHHDISFSATNATVDVNGNYAVAGMRWSATDVTPVNPILRSVGGATRTLTIAGAFDCYRAAGEITFANENAANRLNFTFTGARRTPANGWNDIRSGGVNFPREVIFNGNANNTRWRLLDAFSARIDAGANPINNGSVYLQRGVFDTNGQNAIMGRFNAHRYANANFTSPRELIISGASHWTIQGRTGNLTAGSVPDTEAMDLRGTDFTFNMPSAASYWYFSGANIDSTANTEGVWVGINLGRSANVPREVPSIGIGYRHTDIDISVDAWGTPFHFRELRLTNLPAPLANRQIYIQTWNNAASQLIFKGLVDFGNRTNVNPNNGAGTVIRGPHAAPADAAWSNISRFEKQVIIGNNSQVPFWGNFRFDAPITVGDLSRVWFSREGGSELTAPIGNRYRFNDNVTLGKASIAYFYGQVEWPVSGKTLLLGDESVAYVGDVPSTINPPSEFGANTWQNIVLGSQARLILNNGEGTGTSDRNTIVNLTFGEFSVVELNTEINTLNASATPQTRITGNMTASFSGTCTSWATLRSILDGKQADLNLNIAQTINALVVKDVNVIDNLPGFDLTVNVGADAGNNSNPANSLTFTNVRQGRNFYWVGGTNKDKTLNPFRKAADTNYDGIPDDNGDNILWSNPVNWYSEDASLPLKTSLTAAEITAHNQCVPTIVDNVYFLNDSFRGGNNSGNIFTNRRNVLVDIPQGQARNFEWHITAAAFSTSPHTGTGFIANCTNCNGPARFTNEQQPILPTTEMQIAGNLRWAPPGGTGLSTSHLPVTEAILRNDFIARFSFIGTGTPQTGPGTGPTVHTIESNGQRFAGEVMFDNRYSTWMPIDSLTLRSHRHATSYPIPPAMTPGGVTAWSRASINISQGALDMSSASYKAGQPRRISLEGDWTISGLFDWAHFDASTSEVIFSGSADGSANANNANIVMNENLIVPAPAQPVAQPANDPNGNYDPARRRFYDLIINKRQNTWDVRVLNSPVSALRNIHIQRGRLWDNDEVGAVPMQIKGNLNGNGTFVMNNGTSLFLGTNAVPITDNANADVNRYMNGGNPVYNLGTDFPAALNGYPTTFPMGYARNQITLHENSTVVYWARAQQNVSATPVYGNLRLENPNRAHLIFNDAQLTVVRKRHVINEDVTGGVTYNLTTLNHSLALPTNMSGTQQLRVAGILDLCYNGYASDMVNNGLNASPRTNGGVDLLDHGNQIAFVGSRTDKTLFIGPGSYLTLGAARDINLRDAYNRTFNLTNVATSFPTGYDAVTLHPLSVVNYNAGVAQTVRGLNGAGNASYGHLMIANRDRGTASSPAPLNSNPVLATKTLDGAATIRGRLRIYPNAHLMDNGYQITMTDTSYLHMTSTLPAIGGLATSGGRTQNANDLHDLRLTWTNMPNIAAPNPPFNGESRLTLGSATTATLFPTNIPNDRVLLQSRTTIVYNAGVPQDVRTFTNATDTTQIYANLAFVNPSASATAPVNKTAINQAGSGAAAQAANAAGDATSNNTLGFQIKGDLIIAPNNSFVDNGYQVRNPNNNSGDGYFHMPVLKTTADAITPTGGRATLAGGDNPTGANGVSRIVLGTAAIATDFPVSFSGNNDLEINFEVSSADNLYGNVVYNSGRRQTIRALNNTSGGGVRTYANLTLTNPSATPNGPVPKRSNGDFRVRGTVTINPNNNLRLRGGHTLTPYVVSGSVPRLHMFSNVATATSPTAIAHNDQNIGGAGAVNGPAIMTIGTRDNGNNSFPAFANFNATHLFLELGTTVVYNFGDNTSTVATPSNQNVQALGHATDAQATYANLWFTAPQATANRPDEVIHKTITAGTSGFTQNRVRGSLLIGPIVNLVDNGIQIVGAGATPQDFRMFAEIAPMQAYMNTPAAHGLPSLPGSYATNAVFESIAYGQNSTLYGAGSAPPAATNGASALTLGNATTATQFPTFTGANGFVDANIQMDADTYVRYNAGVNQTIRGLFGATLTALNNYANVELVNPAGAGTAVKTLNGNARIRGNLMIGGRVAGNRFLATINYASFGQANELSASNHNIHIQGNWIAFSSGNRNTLNSAFAFSGAANTINNLFNAGTGGVTFEGNGKAQILASGSVVSGTGAGFTQTVSNRFYNVTIDKGTAGTVHGRTVYLREDPMLIQQSVTFTNGYFWSNADGSENNGTVNRQDDDNQMTFLNNPGVTQVLGAGTFPGAPGPHNNSYVVGAVRKIGTSATPASAVGGANTFDFPIGHTPFVAGNLPDTWIGRGYYYAPSGVLDLTANHDFVARYYGTNANLAGTTIPAGIRPQDITTPGAGSHYPTNVKQASLRFINESEFWTIDYSNKIGPTTTSGLAFRAKLSWDSNPNRTAINTSFSTPPLKVAHWTNKGSGLMWYDEGKSASLGTSFSGVQVSNSTSHNGPFNNADDAISILPIELVQFNARAVEGDREKVEITWQTAWERDNDYFEVEKSRDGINFQSIARVEPKGRNGFSNSIQNYVHYDEQPWLGKNYYRLKQVDFDGTTTFSKIEVVVFERNALAPTAGNMEVYPNPFNNTSQTLNVVLPEGGVGEGWLVIWDMAGREMYRERIADAQTRFEITPEESQGKFAKGTYIIKAVGRDKAFTAKVVIE